MTTLWQRVIELRGLRGLTQAELARRAGMGSLLSEIEQGRVKSTTKLPALADALKTYEKYLATGKGPRDRLSVEDDPCWSPVNSYRAKASQGGGSEDDEGEYQEAHRLMFRADSLARQGLYANKLGVYYGDGDSMEPTLHDRDALMFNTAEINPVDGELFIIEYDGRRLAKRLENIGGRWFFTSDNKIGKWRKPVAVDDPKHEFSIIGRIRWIARWVK